MTEPFIAEIQIFGFNFAPRGWAQCQGQVMPIAQNTALFSLVGTIYGGDGTSTFGLPNFKGCSPISIGQGPGLSDRAFGQAGGVDSVTLIAAELPSHQHGPIAVGATADQGTLRTPGTPLEIGAAQVFSATSDSTVAIGAAAMNATPHENRQPYLELNFCIALQGIFPPRD